MRKKNRLQAAVLATIMAVAIVGCGEKAPEGAQEAASAAESSEATTAESSEATTAESSEATTTQTSATQNPIVGKLNSSGELTEAELAQIESDFMHMEYNGFLAQEFHDKDEIDWNRIYQGRTKKTFTPVKYKCVSGRKIGYTYSVRFKYDEQMKDDVNSKTFFNHRNPDRIVTFEKKGALAYELKSNEFLLEDGCKATFDVNLRQFGKCRVIVFCDSEEDSDTYLVVTCDGKMIADIPYASFSKVNEIGVMDYDLDGLEDLIVSGENGSEKHIEVYECEDDSFGTDQCYFLVKNYLSEAADKVLGDDYSVDNVKKFLLLYHYREDDEGYYPSDYEDDQDSAPGKKQDDDQDLNLRLYGYDSYKEAYYQLVSKVEAEEDRHIAEGTAELQKAFCRYDLINLDNDKTPELAVLDSDGNMNIYTYKDGMLQVYSEVKETGGAKETTSETNTEAAKAPKMQYTYPQLIKKLGYGGFKVTKLFDNSTSSNREAKFTEDIGIYTIDIDYTKRDIHRDLTVTLSNGDRSVTDYMLTYLSKMYLIEKPDGGTFLVLCTHINLYDDEFYIYNLSGTFVYHPMCMEGKFKLFNGEIKDTTSFDLMTLRGLVGISTTRKTFYMDPSGEIKCPDDAQHYIKGSSIDPGEPIVNKGDVVKTKKELTLEVGYDMDKEASGYQPKLKEITIPAGTKLTLYGILENRVYLRLPDGRQTVIKFVNSHNPKYSSDSSIPTIYDLFDDIPKTVVDADWWAIMDMIGDDVE